MTNYTFLIKWTDVNNISYTVGALTKENNMYYFKYNSNKEALQEAKQNGFKWVPTFFDENKIYKSAKLFDFFQTRLPKDDTDSSESELFERDCGKVFTDHYYMEKVNEVAVKKQKL